MAQPRSGIILTNLVLVLALGLGLGLALTAGAPVNAQGLDFLEPKACIGTLSDNTGRSSFSTPSRILLKRFPTLEAVTPVPAFMDPFARETIPLLCRFSASDSAKGIHKAKGRFTIDLFILDHQTRTFEQFGVHSGRFKTREDGHTLFETAVGLEGLAAGRPREDLAVWFFTRARFTKKRGTWGSASCSLRAPLDADPPIPTKAPGYQACSGHSLFVTESRCRLSQFPTLESVASIPPRFDLSARETARIACRVSAYDDLDPINKAKGVLSADLYLLDHTTRTFDRVPLDRIEFKTRGEGFVIFDFEFDTDLFADGFESGDTSAWIHTRTGFTSKKADSGIAGCEITD